MISDLRASCHVVMAVRNRRKLTARSLRRILDDATVTSITVVDCGSTDDTVAWIVENCPTVEIVRADSDVYWASGMRLGALVASRMTTTSHLVWLNDDADLHEGAVEELLRSALQSGDKRSIWIGSLGDPGPDGLPTYGGRVVAKRLPLTFTLLSPSNSPRRAETFNGNLVIMPWSVYEDVGGICDKYVHHYADYDFGLRANAKGFRVYVAPGYFGTVSRNSFKGTFADTALSRRARLRHLASPKGLPPREHAYFLAKHGGSLWPIQLVGTYWKTLGRIMLRR